MLLIEQGWFHCIIFESLFRFEVFRYFGICFGHQQFIASFLVDFLCYFCVAFLCIFCVLFLGNINFAA